MKWSGWNTQNVFHEVWLWVLWTVLWPIINNSRFFHYFPSWLIHRRILMSGSLLTLKLNSMFSHQDQYVFFYEKGIVCSVWHTHTEILHCSQHIFEGTLCEITPDYFRWQCKLMFWGQDSSWVFCDWLKNHHCDRMSCFVFHKFMFLQLNQAWPFLFTSLHNRSSVMEPNTRGTNQEQEQKNCSKSQWRGLTLLCQRDCLKEE